MNAHPIGDRSRLTNEGQAIDVERLRQQAAVADVEQRPRCPPRGRCVVSSGHAGQEDATLLRSNLANADVELELAPASNQEKVVVIVGQKAWRIVVLLEPLRIPCGRGQTLAASRIDDEQL